MTTEASTFEGYAILELMGHRRLAGKVSEATIAGASFIRIDCPREGESEVTQFYSPSSVYCITPTTEEIVKRMAHRNSPTPVSPYELLPAPSASEAAEVDEEDHEIGF